MLGADRRRRSGECELSGVKVLVPRSKFKFVIFEFRIEDSTVIYDKNSLDQHTTGTGTI